VASARRRIADHAERLLIVARLPPGDRPLLVVAPGVALFMKSSDVVVQEREGLLGLLAQVLGPHAVVVVSTTIPWTTKPSGASTRRTSFIPR